MSDDCRRIGLKKGLDGRVPLAKNNSVVTLNLSFLVFSKNKKR
jgi:hypothetical protein